MQKSNENKKATLNSVEAKHTAQRIEHVALNQIVPGLYQRQT